MSSVTWLATAQIRKVSVALNAISAVSKATWPEIVPMKTPELKRDEEMIDHKMVPVSTVVRADTWPLSALNLRNPVMTIKVKVVVAVDVETSSKIAVVVVKITQEVLEKIVVRPIIKIMKNGRIDLIFDSYANELQCKRV